MDKFFLLSEVENEVIRLSELTKLYNVITNGLEESSLAEIISAVQYIQGSLQDIDARLSVNFQSLHEVVMKNENSN